MDGLDLGGVGLYPTWRVVIEAVLALNSWGFWGFGGGHR